MKRSVGIKVKMASYVPGKRLRSEVMVRFDGSSSQKSGAEPVDVIAKQDFDNFAISTLSDNCNKHQRCKPSHDEQMEEQALAWQNLQDALFSTYVGQQKPISSRCVVCDCAVDNPIRCLECGPFKQFCWCCEQDVHLYQLHKPEIWQTKTFVPYTRPEMRLWRRTDHDCNNCEERVIDVVDDKGRIHAVRIAFCKDIPDVCTLMHFHCWSASPKRPNVAFSIALLELLHALTLECAVSVRGFVNTLQWKNNLTHQQNAMIYNALIGNSMSSFRSFRHRVDDFSTQKSGIEFGFNKCPACAKDGGSLTLAMDGNFGLVRKRNSGKSYVEPATSQTGFFLKGDMVDAFIENYQNDNDSDKICNNFLAGNVVRSRMRNAKLDIRGVFGSVCRHEMPVLFMDMKHGERLAYPVLLIKELLKCLKPGCRLQIAYDVGCNLHRHLEKSPEQEIKSRVTLGVPVFHAYGHQSSCQVLYNVRHLKGFGLMEGEGTERLWSYLRPLAKITKEMASSRRTDLLNLALSHYCRRKICGLPTWIDRRLNRANSVLNAESSSLDQIICEINSNRRLAVTVEDVQQWYVEQVQHLSKKVVDGDKTAAWERKYVAVLQSYYHLRQEAKSRSDTEFVRIAFSKADELAKELMVLEAKHRITDRWSQSHPQYISVSCALMESELIKILTRMKATAANRLYLINLLPKYSDGQAMSTRLSKKLNKAAIDIANDVKLYNDHIIPGASKFQQQITEVDARNPENNCYTCINCIADVPGSSVPVAIKWKAIEHLHMIERAKEESLLVLSDLRIAMNHFATIHERVIGCALSEKTSPGESALLLRQAYDTMPIIHHLWHVAAKHVELLPTEPVLPHWLIPPSFYFNIPDEPLDETDYTDDHTGDSDSDNVSCDSTDSEDEAN